MSQLQFQIGIFQKPSWRSCSIRRRDSPSEIIKIIRNSHPHMEALLTSGGEFQVKYHRIGDRPQLHCRRHACQSVGAQGVSLIINGG